MLNCSPFLNAGEGGDAGRGAGRGRGRGGGRGRGEGGRGRGGGDVSSDIPSAGSTDVGTGPSTDSQETGPSTDVGTGPSTDLEARPSAPPKKPRIRGESQVPDDDKEPATEEAKILITPNGKE